MDELPFLVRRGKAGSATQLYYEIRIDLASFFR
jgi:hypothetical protein